MLALEKCPSFLPLLPHRSQATGMAHDLHFREKMTGEKKKRNVSRVWDSQRPEFLKKERIEGRIKKFERSGI